MCVWRATWQVLTVPCTLQGERRCDVSSFPDSAPVGYKVATTLVAMLRGCCVTHALRGLLWRKEAQMALSEYLLHHLARLVSCIMWCSTSGCAWQSLYSIGGGVKWRYGWEASCGLGVGGLVLMTCSLRKRGTVLLRAVTVSCRPAWFAVSACEAPCTPSAAAHAERGNGEGGRAGSGPPGPGHSE